MLRRDSLQLSVSHLLVTDCAMETEASTLPRPIEREVYQSTDSSGLVHGDEHG